MAKKSKPAKSGAATRPAGKKTARQTPAARSAPDKKKSPRGATAAPPAAASKSRPSKSKKTEAVKAVSGGKKKKVEMSKSAPAAPPAKPSKKPPVAAPKAAGAKTAKSPKSKSQADKNQPPRPPAPTNLADAKAAALKLAAAAGLRPVQKASENGDEPAAAAKRLTKSPLGKRELDRYREILLQKRAEVAGDVTGMESEALSSASGSLSSMPQHMADQGSDEYDQSLALGLAASQRKLLREIDAALERIDNGTFGICEALGIAIHKDRLEATPWSRLSLEGARQVDRVGR